MRRAWLLLLPLLAACDSTPSAVKAPAGASATAEPAPETPAPDTTALPPPDTARARAQSARRDTLRLVRQRHAFSNPKGQPDVFQLVFRGPSLLAGTGEFTITDATGQVIFREMLTAPDLEAALVYELKTPTATPAEREAYLRRRLDTFFQPAQFRAPAVGPKASFPAGLENLDRATWDDLRQRPDAIRFEYLKGKEDRQHIAWSPLKEQTVRLP